MGEKLPTAAARVLRAHLSVTVLGPVRTLEAFGLIQYEVQYEFKTHLQ